MVVATFFLHLTRANVPIFWYVIFLVLACGYLFDKFKDIIMQEKEEIVKREDVIDA